jgi:phosphotransferase system enzyme I (PtsI)
MFNGIGVSKGFAIGAAHVLHRNQVDVTARKLTKKQVPAECRRLRRAIKLTKTELLTARDSIPKDAPNDISAFIETHILMLDDTLLSDTPIDIIKEQQCNAEAALQQQREAMAKVFGAMDDQYLATRIDDVNHVIDAVLRTLNSGEEPVDDVQWKGQIVIADDLTPADTVMMKSQGVAGFVTETGGQLSHTAILARSLGIPAIVGVHNIRHYVVAGETLSIDGENGMLLAEPSDDMLGNLRKQQKAYKQQQKALEKLIDTPSVTQDGIKVTLSANIEIEEDLKALKRVNASGVGLYRTEFLYLNRETLPTEQEHIKVYSKVLRALKGAPLTIRTADLGSDKVINPPATTESTGPLAHNPAMGLRGIRLCLNDTALFITQLRAIYRASVRGPIRILLPMITNTTEIMQTLAIIDSVKAALTDEGIEFDNDIPIGGMIEVPASAIVADQFAEHLDFLSIGTNDLIQYTLAIDRIDDQVNYLYDPLNPAVLQLIKHVLDAGKQAGIPVALCGDMASDSRYVRLLLGLGLTDFSMPPNSILEAKHALINSRKSKIKKSANAMLKTHSIEDRLVLLERINRD